MDMIVEHMLKWTPSQLFRMPIDAQVLAIARAECSNTVHVLLSASYDPSAPCVYWECNITLEGPFTLEPIDYSKIPEGYTVSMDQYDTAYMANIVISRGGKENILFNIETPISPTGAEALK